jgi:hypothetical protein
MALPSDNRRAVFMFVISRSSRHLDRFGLVDNVRSGNCEGG